MFQLDFCLWVSRFELFMIELHTILVQGIYEKKRFFFFWGDGGGILSVQEALARHIGIPWGCFG